MRQIPGQQLAGDRRVRHHPPTARLRCLRPHPQHPMRRIEIIRREQAQLLAPQRRVVGQREHQPVPQRLPGRDLEHRPPLPVRRDPRQHLEPRHQTATTGRPIAGAVAAADRVAVPDALLDDEVVEQPHDRDPQLQRRVREPRARVECNHVRTVPPCPLAQIPDIPCDLRPADAGDVDVVSSAEPQVVDERPRIGVNSPR